MSASKTCRCYTDEAKIYFAFNHLLTNALTYTSASGTIVIRSEKRHDVVAMTISDTGKGMQPDVIEHIFEPFFRGDEARTVNLGGVGLGLTIVKMTIEAHGGAIVVNSQPGKGTTFSISLPVEVLNTSLAV
ncbi:MAG: ATP-binding protein [Anaerolineae bacterium]